MTVYGKLASIDFSDHSQISLIQPFGQNGQILHAHPALRQRILPVIDATRLGLQQLPNVQRYFDRERRRSPLVFTRPIVAFHMLHTFLPNVEKNSSPDDNRIPLSLKYHLADIYLEELDKVLAWDSEAGDERPPRAPIDTLIAPFLTLLARTPSNHTFDRVTSAVLEPLVQSLAPTSSPEPPSKKRRRLLGTERSFVEDNACTSSSPTTTAAAAADTDKSALHQALLKQVFSVASERDTRDSNRCRLYKFWKSNLEDDDDDQRARRDVDGS